MAKIKTEKLFEPITIRKTIIKNRIVFPPVVRVGMEAPNGIPGQDRIAHYEQLASNGIGLIILEACCIHPDGRLYPSQLGLWDDDQIEGMSRLVATIHNKGAACVAQIHHGGGKTHPEVNMNPIGPSSYVTEGGSQVRQASIEELEAVCTQFIAAAVRAEKAGADGVELHGAHGYLLSEMASPLHNKRSDAYGGPLENRLRLALEIISGIRESTREDFVVGYRMGGTEPTHADGVEIAKLLEAAGVDYLHVSYGIPKPQDEHRHISRNFPYNSVVYGASLVKQAVRVPVIAVNRIDTIERGEWLLQNGHADMVAYARPMLADVDFLKHAMAGEKSGCIYCNPRCFWFTDSSKCPARRKKP